MIKILIPELNKKIKTDIRGLWCNDRGKIFYDYLWIKELTSSKKIYLITLEVLKRKYNQEAIFYIDDNDIGYIYYNKDKQDILHNKKGYIIPYDRLKFNRLELRQWLRRILKRYKGLTIYNDKAHYCYIVKVYYNRKDK